MIARLLGILIFIFALWIGAIFGIDSTIYNICMYSGISIILLFVVLDARPRPRQKKKKEKKDKEKNI